MVCATIVGVFVAMPIVKATRAYNVSAEAYAIDQACLDAGAVADAWAVLGPIGLESQWRATEREDCGRRDMKRLQESIYLGIPK